MLNLDAQQTALALPYAQLVPAIAEAAAQLADGTIHAPERQVVPIGGAGVLLCMPAVGAGIGVTKLITVHRDNARHGLPAIQGEVIVFDTATGERRMLMDGPTVTARRTAAVSMFGIQRLAQSAPASAVLIGTGVQAAAHADALIEFFGVRKLTVAGRDEAHARQFCAWLAARHAGVGCMAVTMQALEDACAQADVVIALTTATSPVMPATLPPHTLAVGVGAFKPEMAELPATLLHARGIVVDHLAGAQHEAGDLLRAQVDWSGVNDLAQLAAGEVRRNPNGMVLKTVGHAAWDLAAARVACAALPTPGRRPPARS
jgi:1-piperideine-2-carboxylate/1-pyrroline-2-carboxylate reductase [NAD(P)H]